MARDIFLEELEQRLEENRRLAAGSWLPKPLWGVASYLAFHTFRSLVLASLLLVILLAWLRFDFLLMLGKTIFFY